MSAATTQLPAGARVRRRPARRGPAVYFVALLLIGVMLAPVVYIILGGFRTNAQITTDPAGLPGP